MDKADHYGKVAYVAYCGVWPKGPPPPPWEGLPAVFRRAFQEAAEAVLLSREDEEERNWERNDQQLRLRSEPDALGWRRILAAQGEAT